MDDYLAGPPGLSDAIDLPIPASPSSSMAGSSRGTNEPAALSQISQDIAAISSSMLTRRDKSEMVAELRAVIREEIAAVRADLTALEHRVDAWMLSIFRPPTGNRPRTLRPPGRGTCS
ncbi:Hypothetical predicted protein [Pelobates cultripes]|uniref:Uncharacterized protein n=1 Tax=Pelobates cultripes TaxID=61616 RepID=A0AAD1W4U5_PELCU|nr:Hypothetical predicted protein [Pelobates cultripes]